jgi:hypothetical protein
MRLPNTHFAVHWHAANDEWDAIGQGQRASLGDSPPCLAWRGGLRGPSGLRHLAKISALIGDEGNDSLVRV